EDDRAMGTEPAVRRWQLPRLRAPPTPRIPMTDTKDKIFKAALALFRRRGFDKTTMRDVAKAAKVALGGAYYYFPSKEAIVLAYYEKQQVEHAIRARAAMVEAHSVRDRIAAVMHTKLDV